MEEAHAKACRYAKLLDSSIADPLKFAESIDNISISVVIHGEEGETVVEYLQHICDAYEAEFKRLGIVY